VVAVVSRRAALCSVRMVCSGQSRGLGVSPCVNGYEHGAGDRGSAA